MTIAEAIAEFRDAAISKADMATPASKDHALHKRMAKAYEYLTSLGSEGNKAFELLLQDASPHVRGWVASQLLSQNNPEAIPVMKLLTKEPSIRGFTAETTLKEFHAGRLCSPFQNKKA